MELLKVIFTTLGSIMLLFILTRLIGNKQMSQLTLFDYVNGITIGSIAAEMATDVDGFLAPMLAMIVYALVTLVISVVGCKSMRLRRFFSGEPMILYDNGRFYKRNFMRARIDLSEFLMLSRNNGYFDMEQVQTAVLEPNGRISFLPKSTARPIAAQDFGLPVEQELIFASIIFDGQILYENLRFIGKDEKWLKKTLGEKNAPSVDDIFLATCDLNGKLYFYPRADKGDKRTVLE